MKKKIAIITGAGVSAESGLSTYRDNGGMWDNYDPMEVASIDGWYRNPGFVLDFYNNLKGRLKNTQPNAAHLAMAKLEETADVCIITQNVDNLHEKAGSTRIIHLHGEATKVRPEKGRYDRDYSEEEVFDIGYDDVVLGDLAPNGSQLRPHIVFFGEAVPKMDKAIDIVEQADIVLIVGTSLQVYPAASLYRFAKSDAEIFVIDPAELPISESRIKHIRKKATEGMAEIMDYLSSR